MCKNTAFISWIEIGCLLLSRAKQNTKISSANKIYSLIKIIHKPPWALCSPFIILWDFSLGFSFFLLIFCPFICIFLEQNLLLQLLYCFALQFLFYLASRLKQQSDIVHVWYAYNVNPKIYKGRDKALFVFWSFLLYYHTFVAGDPRNAGNLVSCSRIHWSLTGELKPA